MVERTEEISSVRNGKLIVTDDLLFYQSLGVC